MQQLSALVLSPPAEAASALAIHRYMDRTVRDAAPERLRNVLRTVHAPLQQAWPQPLDGAIGVPVLVEPIEGSARQWIDEIVAHRLDGKSMLSVRSLAAQVLCQLEELRQIQEPSGMLRHNALTLDAVAVSAPSDHMAGGEHVHLVYRKVVGATEQLDARIPMAATRHRRALIHGFGRAVLLGTDGQLIARGSGAMSRPVSMYGDDAFRFLEDLRAHLERRYTEMAPPEEEAARHMKFLADVRPAKLLDELRSLMKLVEQERAHAAATERKPIPPILDATGRIVKNFLDAAGRQAIAPPDAGVVRRLLTHAFFRPVVGGAPSRKRRGGGGAKRPKAARPLTPDADGGARRAALLADVPPVLLSAFKRVPTPAIDGAKELMRDDAGVQVSPGEFARLVAMMLSDKAVGSDLEAERDAAMEGRKLDYIPVFVISDKLDALYDRVDPETESADPLDEAAIIAKPRDKVYKYGAKFNIDRKEMDAIFARAEAEGTHPHVAALERMREIIEDMYDAGIVVPQRTMDAIYEADALRLNQVMGMPAGTVLALGERMGIEDMREHMATAETQYASIQQRVAEVLGNSVIVDDEMRAGLYRAMRLTRADIEAMPLAELGVLFRSINATMKRSALGDNAPNYDALYAAMQRAIENVFVDALDDSTESASDDDAASESGEGAPKSPPVFFDTRVGKVDFYDSEDDSSYVESGAEDDSYDTDADADADAGAMPRTGRRRAADAAAPSDMQTDARIGYSITAPTGLIEHAICAMVADGMGAVHQTVTARAFYSDGKGGQDLKDLQAAAQAAAPDAVLDEETLVSGVIWPDFPVHVDAEDRASVARYVALMVPIAECDAPYMREFARFRRQPSKALRYALAARYKGVPDWLMRIGGIDQTTIDQARQLLADRTAEMRTHYHFMLNRFEEQMARAGNRQGATRSVCAAATQTLVKWMRVALESRTVFPVGQSFHTIEDSFSAAHTKRVGPSDGRRYGAVLEAFYFGNQNDHSHGQLESFAAINRPGTEPHARAEWSKRPLHDVLAWFYRTLAEISAIQDPAERRALTDRRLEEYEALLRDHVFLCAPAPEPLPALAPRLSKSDL